MLSKISSHALTGFVQWFFFHVILTAALLLSQYLESVTAMYISPGEQAFAVQKLVTMTCE